MTAFVSADTMTAPFLAKHLPRIVQSKPTGVLGESSLSTLDHFVEARQRFLVLALHGFRQIFAQQRSRLLHSDHPDVELRLSAVAVINEKLLLVQREFDRLDLFPGHVSGAAEYVFRRQTR